MEASRKVKLKYSTFKRRSESLGIYLPNQGRKGIQREDYESAAIRRYEIEDVLKGLHPEYKMKRARLLKTGYKKNECEKCGISEWLGEPITVEIHHIDGDNTNNLLSNLQMLCPNCHSQTPNHSRVLKLMAD